MVFKNPIIKIAIVIFILVTFLFLSPKIPYSENQIQAQLIRPIGGMVISVAPNPPLIAAVPNPCFVPGSWLITLGLPSPGVYVLSFGVRVINGINPPRPGLWVLGRAVRTTIPCPIIIPPFGASGAL